MKWSERFSILYFWVVRSVFLEWADCRSPPPPLWWRWPRWRLQQIEFRSVVITRSVQWLRFPHVVSWQSNDLFSSTHFPHLSSGTFQMKAHGSKECKITNHAVNKWMPCRRRLRRSNTLITCQLITLRTSWHWFFTFLLAIVRPSWALLGSSTLACSDTTSRFRCMKTFEFRGGNHLHRYIQNSGCHAGLMRWCDTHIGARVKCLKIHARDRTQWIFGVFLSNQWPH